MPIKINKERTAVIAVGLAYEHAVRKLRGGFTKCRPLTGKLAKSAIDIYDIAQQRGITVVELMEEAVGYYSLGFCQNAFYRAWPPVHYVISAPSRDRLRIVPKRVYASRGLAAQAAPFIGVLNSMELQFAREAIKSGWPPGSSPELREYLLKHFSYKPSLHFEVE